MDTTSQLRSYVGRSPDIRNEYLNACEGDHGQLLWGKFTVPDQIFNVAPVPQKSGLLNMPLEILFNIMSSCTSVDTVCLALTCKALLQGCYKNIRPIPSAEKHSEEGHKCMGIFTLLTLTRPVDARGYPTTYFIPCYDCFHQKNSGGVYWTEKQDPSLPDTTQVLNPLSIRCPWCSARAEVR
ncbi:hypothetical protein F4803DRAFT_511540 [Xylaria telfairii]|nr:hypothetical protein F4803DRAFT_511540 [Xylaria telfairii]